jgi:hypothetical protein
MVSRLAVTGVIGELLKGVLGDLDSRWWTASSFSGPSLAFSSSWISTCSSCSAAENESRSRLGSVYGGLRWPLAAAASPFLAVSGSPGPLRASVRRRKATTGVDCTFCTGTDCPRLGQFGARRVLNRGRFCRGTARPVPVCLGAMFELRPHLQAGDAFPDARRATDFAARRGGAE